MSKKRMVSHRVLMFAILVLGGVQECCTGIRNAQAEDGVPTFEVSEDSQPPQGTPASWKTYVNTTYRYKVSYPFDWEVQSVTAESSQAAVRFTKIVTRDGKYLYDAAVDILVEPNPLRKPPTEEWYRAWVKQIPAGMNLEGIAMEETTFKNLPALNVGTSTLFVTREPHMFRITWHVAGNDDQALVTSTKQIYERMLSAFEFLE